MYLPVGFSSETYPIPRFTLKIPLLAGCSSWIGKPVTITWDPTKTSITSSRLVITAKSDADPVALDVKFNDIVAKSFFWGEGTKGTEKSDVVDVSLINGSNLVEAKTCKHLWWIGVVGVDVDVYVEVIFGGETPQRPWWEVLQEWFKAYWPWIAIATGLVIVGGTTYMYIARPRGS